MYQTKAEVEGMMCGMCEAHIADTVRKTFPEAKSVKANRSRNSVEFLTEEKPDLDRLKAAIDKTGYHYGGAETVSYEKKKKYLGII